MSKPRLLDLFCGAGGAAMGYHRAGFEVVGVDIKPQPNYPFEFVQDDALALLSTFTPSVSGWWDEPPFAAIHASPPCQAHSTIGKQIRKLGRTENQHEDFVAATRELLKNTGLPYVIENVVGAPLVEPTMICGSSLGLDVRRHRLFETNWPLLVPSCAHGWQTPRFRSLDARRNNVSPVVPMHGTGRHLASVVGVHGHLNYSGERAIRESAMEIDWMSPYELSQAIPPAYCELIGHQLMTYLRASGRVPDDSSLAHRSDTSASLDLGSRTQRTSVPADSESYGRSLPSVSAASGASSPRSAQPRGDRD